jgi:hypothetical protein
MSESARPMLEVLAAPWRLRLSEHLGLSHGPQVIAVPAPPAAGTTGWFTAGAVQLAWQRSRVDAGQAFVFLTEGLPADAVRELVPVDGAPPEPVCTLVGAEVGNGRFRLRLNRSGIQPDGPDGIHPGPVLGVAVGTGPWRGTTLLDTRAAVLAVHDEVLEDGPLRVVWRWRADFGRGRHYTAILTVDAGVDFVRLDESFQTGAADQLVWDFHGPDLADQAWILDADGQREARFDRSTDHRLGRVWCWTQGSQQIDNTDGIGLVLPGGDLVGMVALAGGEWRGGRLNHSECWVRRWLADDAATRRGWPALAKEDLTKPDGIAARGTTVCTEHVGFESWIGQGRRITALVLAPAGRMRAPGGPHATPVLGHMEGVPAPERWHAQQNGLRRIHVQHGVIPLQDQLAWVLVWPQERAAPPTPVELDLHTGARPVEQQIETLHDYLRTRLHGLWYGTGLALANPVVGRAIGPSMLAWAPRFAADPAAYPQRVRLRAWYAALAYLNADDRCYPGDLVMRPLGDHDGAEPTVQGMPNQNFLTDVLVVHGTCAEAFPGHPAAPAWRARAERMWSRQLAYHCYPGGAWEESHTYYLHVAATVYPWLAARRANGGSDGFAEPGLHAFLACMVAMITPADGRLGAAAGRELVPWGDHGPELFRWVGLWGPYAEAVAAHAPALAGHLAWCAAVNRAPACAVPPHAPALANQHIPGLGNLWRSVDAAGRDELVAFRSGGAWAHTHADESSLMLWACGRNLIADAASGADGVRGHRKFFAEGHSRWMPRDWDPVFYLQRHNRGRIVAQDLAAERPWALGSHPIRNAAVRRGAHGAAPAVLSQHHFLEPIRHQRLVVRLAADALLVVDRSDGREAGVVRWHLCGEPRIAAGAAVLPLPDGEQMWLVPLTGEPLLGERDEPRNPAFATTEVRVETGHAVVAATVITWGRGGRPEVGPGRVHGHPVTISPDAVTIGDHAISWPAWEE